MQISELQIENFRSIQSLQISFDAVTALLGGNNAGKSTVLTALEMFFEAAPKLSDDDYRNRTAESIEITVVFKNLTDSELDEFGTAVADGILTLRRTFSRGGDGDLQYSALSRAYPGFQEIRSETAKGAKRTKYNEVRAKIDDLPTVSNADQIEAHLIEWEQSNSEKLELVFVRGFFGAANVANGKLRKKTSLNLVPAVADANDTVNGNKTSPIVKLLSDIAKQTYENRTEIQEFVERASSEFEELVSPHNFPQLSGISHNLTLSLQKYYSDSRLLADWSIDEGLSVSFPKPTIRVEDQGFETLLTNVGHGLQRAALFSVIQFLSEESSQNEGDEFETPMSDIILLVEEPEIYQHPQKQQVIADAFHDICKDFNAGTGIRFQVIFSTHSEKFTGMQRFQSTRILRRIGEGEDEHHTAAGISISDASNYFAGLVNKPPMPDAAFEAKMHIFSREICEGFFANKVVLVEGVTDKAVLEGVYRSRGRDALSEGVSIISVDGKTKLDKPFYIFEKLGIPTFMVFDNDEAKTTKRTTCNRQLQILAGIAEPIDFPSGCYGKYFAFSQNLESYLSDRMGDEYDNFYSHVASQYGLSVTDVAKTPQAMMDVTDMARKGGVQFELLDQIISAVDALH